ncbi:MAG: hypothetical protein QXF52_01870 [Thermoproteota archaeon]
MRLITIIGRLGTVLFMMGLALALATFLPPGSTWTSSSGRFLSSETYCIEPYLIEPYYWKPLTVSPRNRLYVSVTASGEVHAYLLNVSSYFLTSWAFSWVKERFPSINETDIWYASLNITVLNAFIEANPNTVLWKSNMSRTVSKEFSFRRITNCTIVVSNPSSKSVDITLEYRVGLLVVPEGSLLQSQLLILTGIVLAIPWIIISFRERKSEAEFIHKFSGGT